MTYEPWVVPCEGESPIEAGWTVEAESLDAAIEKIQEWVDDHGEPRSIVSIECWDEDASYPCADTIKPSQSDRD